MKIKILLLCLLISGCTTAVPVTPQKFPEVPDKLMQECPNLPEHQMSEEFDKLISKISENYAEYYKCQVKVKHWIIWYNEQKKNYNSIK